MARGHYRGGATSRATDESRWEGAVRVPLGLHTGECRAGETETASTETTATAKTETISTTYPTPLQQKECGFGTRPGPELVLELVGLDSPTRTIFARIVPTANEEGGAEIAVDVTVPVEDLLDRIIEEAGKQHQEQCSSFAPASASTLLELGSVWVMDPTAVDRPQNPPSFRRLLALPPPLASSNSLLLVRPFVALRVHSRPSRYTSACDRLRSAFDEQEREAEPQATNSEPFEHPQTGIVWEHEAHGDERSREEHIRSSTTKRSGANHRRRRARPLVPKPAPTFAVLHKPSGLPSHSTIDNGVENLLYQYQIVRQRAIRKRNVGSGNKDENESLPYATLPQRLDTDTSGLILVATNKSAASYFCKLLARKTTDALQPSSAGGSVESNDQNRPVGSIQKRYRCLVSFSSDTAWDSFRSQHGDGRIVEHFVDANADTPKPFVDVPPPPPAEATSPSSSSDPPPPPAAKDRVLTSRWQSCRLRVRSATAPVAIQTPLPGVHAGGSQRPPQRPPEGPPRLRLCSELEIELLTGRTHQIRGQLAALGCPIVGDALYGDPDAPPLADTMALQCCRLAFPLESRGGGEGEGQRDHRVVDLRLDSAWWREAIAHQQRIDPPDAKCGTAE